MIVYYLRILEYLQMVEYCISIQNTNGCNLNCSVCYANPNKMTDNYLTMSDEMFEKVKSNIIDFDNKFNKRYSIVFGAYCEPTIDNKLWDRVAELKSITKNADIA